MFDSSSSSDANIAHKNSIEAIEQRNNLIETQKELQKQNLTQFSTSNFELQKKYLAENNLNRDFYAIIIYFTFLGVSVYSSSNSLQKPINLEALMSELTGSINGFKDLVNDLEKRKSIIKSLLESTSFKEVTKSGAVEELQDIFTKIFKCKNEFDGLLSQIEILESRASVLEKFSAKGKIANIDRADQFAWDMRETIFNIESEYFKNEGKSISLGKLANELNFRKVETPTEKGIWYPTTVKLMKERIKKIQHTFMLNQLD